MTEDGGVVKRQGLQALVTARRQFVKASALGALAFLLQTPLSAADKAQKFRIGMAATTWLSASPSITSYWNATEGISRLNMGASEADIRKAQFEVNYANGVGEFRQRSSALGVKLEGVYQALYLHDAHQLPEMRAKIHAVASFLKAAGAEYIALGWDLPDTGGKPYPPTAQDVTPTLRAMDELGRLTWEEHRICPAVHPERALPQET